MTTKRATKPASKSKNSKRRVLTAEGYRRMQIRRRRAAK